MLKPLKLKIQTAVFVFVVSVFALILFPRQIMNVVPLSDDLSMIAFSRTWSSEWFSKGLADYFIVYPEYYGSQSNFIRPISNFTFWLFSSLISGHSLITTNRVQLIVFNYGSLIAIAAILFFEIRSMTSSFWRGILGAVFALIIPAFWTTPTPTYTSFVFDGLATLLCLLAFMAARRNKPIIAALWMTAALLTKEITFPVTIAFALHFFIHRNMKGFFALFLGTAIWGLLRLYAFGFHAEGVYVFADAPQDFGYWIVSKLQNLTTLPFGPVFFDEISGTLNPAASLLGRSTILLAVNISFITIILLLFFRRLIDLKSIKEIYFARSSESATALASLSTLLSFSSVAYVGANYRYSFMFLPFLFISVASGIRNRRLQQILIGLMIGGSALASAPSILKYNNGDIFEIYRYDMMESLLAALDNHDRSKPLIILNDSVTGYANPQALQILTDHGAKIIRGTSLYLDNCTHSEMERITTETLLDHDSIRIITKLPNCGRFTFESSPKIGAFISGNTLSRNEQISYELDHEVNLSQLDLGSDWLGRTLTTVISKNSGLDILYYDFNKKSWILLGQNLSLDPAL